MVLVAVGTITLLLGVAWGLQGAYVLPASFMRGPTWIGIGTAVAIVGLLIAFLGVRTAPPAKSS
ncbi:MAG TPA: hypothetical protein VIL58_01400 [Thermoplasmata archaeon]